MADNGTNRRYNVDIDGERISGGSAAALVATRRCRDCIELDDGDLTGDPAEAIAMIAEHCSNTSDYLLDDTPLREAVFRLILEGGNEPRSAEEISEALIGRWSSNPARDISAGVVGRLLEHGRSYRLVPFEEPEEEEDAESSRGCS